MEQSAHYSVPSIAPSGTAFYASVKFPEWKDLLFVGALARQHLARLTLNGERVVADEKLLTELGIRIPDVRQGRDGYLYVLTDDGNDKLFRVAPRQGALSLNGTPHQPGVIFGTSRDSGPWRAMRLAITMAFATILDSRLKRESRRA